jgi:hypothetical protein
MFQNAVATDGQDSVSKHTLVQEAENHVASEEFLEVLEHGSGTSVHQFARQAVLSGNWELKNASPFAYALWFRDVKQAFGLADDNDERLLLATLYPERVPGYSSIAQ